MVNLADQSKSNACSRIAERLRREIGLDASSVGVSVIERTVRLRVKHLGLKSQEDYEHHLDSSKAEWEELIESVVVAETWFFRDRDPFAALVEIVRRDWLPEHPARQFRLLSLPCSSGEEPYSLAMAMLDANIPAERFTIDAADISTRALNRAQRAVYGKNSFRGKYLEFRERFFHAGPDGHALHARVRKCVTFHRANILADDFFKEAAPYDAIFCRNLLIYFDRETQVKALEKLNRLLAPKGVLFVGPAELPLATAQTFVSANLPMAFACRRAADVVPLRKAVPPISARDGTHLRKAGPKIQSPGANIRHSSSLTPSDGRSSQTGSRVGSPATRAIQRAGASPPSPADLAQARELADAGKLAEAAQICQAHLDGNGPSAQAFYLLGLLRDASGDAEALHYYRKALYLEPNHYEAALQLSLLLQRNGDRAEAATLRRRLRRLEAGRNDGGSNAALKRRPERQK